MSNIQINSYNIIPIPKLFNSDLTTTDYWVFNDPSMGSIDTPSTEINFDSRSDGTNNWYGIDLEQAGIFGTGNLSQTDFDCRWNQLSNTTGQYAGWLHNYSGFSSTSQAEGYDTAQHALCTNFDNGQMYTGAVTNATWSAGNDSYTVSFAVGVRYYYELKLRGGDTLTLSNFTDSSYSTVSGTSVTTGTAVTNAMAEHMRYWKMGNYVGGAGGAAFPIDLQAPFSFYNGIRP